MKEKFVGVEIEDDTRILRRDYQTVGKFPVMFETWQWEAVTGHSAIVPVADLDGASNEEFVEAVQEVTDVAPDYTVSRKDKYLFVNFNFSVR